MDRRQYLKHFTQLFTGSLAAQLLNLAAYPLLARLYSPAEFGVFATFVAAAAIPSAAACARFDLAVPTAPQWGRFAILWLCILITVVAGILWGAAAAAYWLAIEGHVPFQALMFGLCVGLTGFCTAGSLYLLRHDLYGLGASSAALRTAGAVVVQVAIGLFWNTSLALIIGFAAGLMAQALTVGWAIWKFAPPKAPKRRQLRVLFNRYKWQVAVDIPNTIIAGLALNLPTFFIATTYGQRIVGFYGIAQRVAVVPVQLFNDALSQIYFQKAARSQEVHGSIWSELKVTLAASGLVAAALVAGIFLFARPVVGAYLGSRWDGVATILIILAPMLAARSVASAIQNTAYILRRAPWLLAHNIANTLAVSLAYVISLVGAFDSSAFFKITAILVSIEYIAFAIVLIWAAHANSLNSTSTGRTRG